MISTRKREEFKMHANLEGEERREFLRIDYEKPLDFKELKGEKLSPKAEMLSRNISACGILFRTEKIPPALSSVIWIQLDDKIMSVCTEIESDLVIHNGGIFGRVVRIAEGEPGKSYDVGVAFLRRKNMTEAEVEQLLSEK
jgi:hypothetical protein